MRYALGMRFLARLGAVSAFLLVMITSLVAIRILAQSLGLSASVVAAIAAVQLPHVMLLSAGLSTYWLADELWCEGHADLLATCGLSSRRIGVAILLPAVVLSMVMTVYNTTAARAAARNLPALRARAELRDIERLGGDKRVARVGPVRLGARAAADGELRDAVLSVRNLVLETPRLHIGRGEVVANEASVTSLTPRFRGTVASARVVLPPPAPFSWRMHLEAQPAPTARSLALALDILPLVLAALVCARRGRRGRRGRWFAIWLGAGLAPLLVVQNALTTAAIYREPSPALLAIVAVPVVATLPWLLLVSRRSR